MADSKISALPASTVPLAGTEVLPIVQSGATKQVSVQNVLSSAQPTGTANGVAFLNASKVLTTGSVLTFDGTNLGVGIVTPVFKLDVVQDANSFAGQRIRNNDVGAAAYAGLIINANGNSWGVRMGSGAANSNALECVIDALGAPVIKSSLSSGGVLTLSNYGAGAATFSAAGVISSVSDETWKIKDGEPVDTDAMIQKLKPGYWYYNDEKKEIFGVERQLGFYAQNVNYAIGPEAAPEPETFTTKNDDGIETTVSKPWGYYDRSVLAVVVMSLQKALDTISSLTARIEALEKV